MNAGALTLVENVDTCNEYHAMVRAIGCSIVVVSFWEQAHECKQARSADQRRFRTSRKSQTQRWGWPWWIFTRDHATVAKAMKKPC